MIKCSSCNSCKIVLDGRTNAEARCMATKSKKGRIITWACTVYKSREDAFWGRVSEFGEDRVKESLEKQNKAPKWCPLKESEETND